MSSFVFHLVGFFSVSHLFSLPWFYVLACQCNMEQKFDLFSQNCFNFVEMIMYMPRLSECKIIWWGQAYIQSVLMYGLIRNSVILSVCTLALFADTHCGTYVSTYISTYLWGRFLNFQLSATIFSLFFLKLPKIWVVRTYLLFLIYSFWFISNGL